jgi:hypothetical protein
VVVEHNLLAVHQLDAVVMVLQVIWVSEEMGQTVCLVVLAIPTAGAAAAAAATSVVVVVETAAVALEVEEVLLSLEELPEEQLQLEFAQDMDRLPYLGLERDVLLLSWRYQLL